MNDLSFLGRVYLRDLDAFVIEEDLHLVEQKLVRIRIRNIEAEMVDELFLFGLPLSPTIFTDLGSDLLTQLGRYRSDTEGLSLSAASRALEFVSSK